MLDHLGNVAKTVTASAFMANEGVVMMPVPKGAFLNGTTRQRP